MCNMCYRHEPIGGALDDVRADDSLMGVNDDDVATSSWPVLLPPPPVLPLTELPSLADEDLPPDSWSSSSCSSEQDGPRSVASAHTILAMASGGHRGAHRTTCEEA